MTKTLTRDDIVPTACIRKTVTPIYHYIGGKQHDVKLVFGPKNDPSDIPLYTLEQALQLASLPSIAPTPPVEKLDTSWNATNIQKATIMATHGTPEQKEQAKSFFRENGVPGMFQKVINDNS